MGFPRVGLAENRGCAEYCGRLIKNREKLFHSKVSSRFRFFACYPSTGSDLIRRAFKERFIVMLIDEDYC